ncbi:MAG: hypothetical protein OXM02_01685 [Bacteroidota bacterium]|nr:hypothetical protein [Bacteroidota bacterium]MDE2955752.1 hypothetical protein [Bacteroidota bacterium]
MGQTVHVREFDVGDYDYRQLMELLTAAAYSGWVLMEARTEPEDRIQALRSQRQLFDDLIRQISH